MKSKAVIGLLVVALIAGAAFAGAKFLGGEAEAETVLYQDPDSVGPDPFTEPAVITADQTTTTTTTVAGASPAAPGATSPGTTAPLNTGPFGGSGLIGECDPEALIRFLNANEDKKKAWAEVLEIDPATVETYIRSLRPVILTRDTRVTNHGFKDGKAYSLQSILAKGTAVLVDEKGELKVRCKCGNPLKPPTNITYKCSGCPPGFTPPPPCAQTCFPTTTTSTATTLPSSTTTTRRGGGRGSSPPTTRPVTTTRAATTTSRAVTTTGSGTTQVPGTTIIQTPTTTQPAATTQPATQTPTTTPPATQPPTTMQQPPTEVPS